MQGPIRTDLPGALRRDDTGLFDMGAQWKAKGKELAANARGKLFGRLAGLIKR